MSGYSAVKFAELLIALVIIALVMIALRVKTGKAWSVIFKAPDRYSKHIETATIIVLLLIFAVFFIINNGYLR
jgi:hypothetical protein